MSEQPTSGPWHIGPHYRGDVESREGRICECMPFNSPRAVINARLIAAAPELLAALKALLKWHSEEYQSNPILDEEARAAIAKAEGRS